MIENLVIVGIIGPFVLAVGLLRVPVAMLFFSLLVGDLLATEASRSSAEIFSRIEPDVLKTILLLLPFLLSLFFLKRRIKKGRVLSEFLLSIFVSLGALVLVADQIGSVDDQLHNSQLWNTLRPLESLIIAAAAGVCLLSVWLTYPKPLKKDKGGHH